MAESRTREQDDHNGVGAGDRRARGVHRPPDRAPGSASSLVGSLGTGKSVLVRGICRGLGVGEDVLSPTFVLFEEYRGPAARGASRPLPSRARARDRGARRVRPSRETTPWSSSSGETGPRRLLDVSDVVVTIGNDGRHRAADRRGVPGPARRSVRRTVRIEGS